MKLRALALTLFSLLLVSVASADDISNNIKSNLTQSSLDALAKDLGPILGGGSFHQGSVLSFPVGFDVGVQVPVVAVRTENKILKDHVSNLAAAWGQVEIGLPARLNVIGRYGKMMDANLAGGGLRYGVIKPIVKGAPALSVSALYNRMDHSALTGQNIETNAVLSADIVFIHPYVGVAYDWTEIKPTDDTFSGLPDSVSRNMKGKANGYRAEAGVNLSVIPFTYLTLGAGLANGEALYHAGLGVNF